MSSKSSKLLDEIFTRLSKAAGPRHWWPGETVDEIIVGAVLTQNTSWHNVEKAIANLKSAGLCDLTRLAAMPPEEFAPLIRSSGYYNLKSKRLHAVAEFFDVRQKLLRDRDSDFSTEALRSELLAVRGVGRETADSILLYALKRQVFVVDAYTIRVMSRHGFCATNASYEEVRKILENETHKSVAHYNEFHALFVWVGHHFCKPTPKCAECPLFHRSCFAEEKSWKTMRNELKQVPPLASREMKTRKKD